MSLSGVGTVIQVNGANFTVADTSKELRANLIRFSTTSTGHSLSSLNGNIYTASNINAGYYYGNAKKLVSLTDAAAGTYGGSDAVVASIVVDATGRITGLSNVNITLDEVLKHGNATANTIYSTNADIGFSATGNIVSSSLVKAAGFEGDGSELTGLTGASSGTYGSEDISTQIVVDANGRITSIVDKTITRDTFSNVVARGSTTGNVVSFSNAGQAIMVTNASGMIAIGNTAPTKAFSVGNKFYVDRAATLSNTVVVSGNVSASYYYGNAKHLVNTTDVADATYGSSTAIPSIQIVNGRVAAITTSAIDVSLQGVTDIGNTTSNTLQFTNATTAFITTAKVGIANSLPTHTLDVGTKFYVDDTSTTDVVVTSHGISAGYLKGEGSNITNIVGGSPSVGGYGSTTSVPVITIGANGTIAGIAAVNIAQTLQAVTAIGASSDQKVTLANTDTSLITSGKVGISNLAPGHQLSVGTQFYVDNGEVTATKYIGDGGLLSNVGTVTSTVKGSTAKVPQITFDSRGRITQVDEIDVQSNVTGAVTGQLAFYSSATDVGGFSALTKDGDNLTLAGTFTTDDMTVNGNLHVTGNTVIHDSVTILDPILTIGNVNISSTQTVGTVFSRADANVAVVYEKSNDGQALNTLVFGYTTDTGAGADILINSSRLLESKFYGNVVATANITSADTITAASFVGSGAQLTNIDFGAVDNNAETRLATAETDIQTLEADLLTVNSNLNTEITSNITTLKADLLTVNSNLNTEITSNITTLKADLLTVNSNLNTEITSNITTLKADLLTVNSNLNTEITSNITTLKANLTSNAARIGTVETKATDLSFSGITTKIEQDLVIGGAGQFKFDQASTKLLIANPGTEHTLAVGGGFYVDAVGSIVSTVGSTLNTGTVEVTGDSSTVDFKTSAGEDADCRIAKSSDGLVVSTGGNGSLAVAMTLYSNTDAKFESNLAIGGELRVSNLVTSNIVFSSDASIQAAQISLDDVVAVSGTTSRAITVGDLNATGTVSAAVKTFNIPHPVVEGKRLQHACIETARADNIYMGEVVLANGSGVIDLDSVNGMTSGTFVALHKDVRVFTTNESDWDAVKGKIEGSKLIIVCQNGVSNAKVSWLVAGTRTDIPDLVVEL
jgi:hypothetical protein